MNTSSNSTCLSVSHQAICTLSELSQALPAVSWFVCREHDEVAPYISAEAAKQSFELHDRGSLVTVRIFKTHDNGDAVGFDFGPYTPQDAAQLLELAVQ